MHASFSVSDQVITLANSYYFKANQAKFVPTTLKDTCVKINTVSMRTGVQDSHNDGLVVENFVQLIDHNIECKKTVSGSVGKVLFRTGPNAPFTIKLERKGIQHIHDLVNIDTCVAEERVTKVVHILLLVPEADNNFRILAYPL